MVMSLTQDHASTILGPIGGNCSLPRFFSTYRLKRKKPAKYTASNSRILDTKGFPSAAIRYFECEDAYAVVITPKPLAIPFELVEQACCVFQTTAYRFSIEVHSGQ